MTHPAHAVDLLDHVDTALDWLDGAECVEEIGAAETVAEYREGLSDIQADLEELVDDG